MFYDPYTAQSAEFERQQLNLMRRHQGLLPIPPPPYVEDQVSWIFTRTMFVLKGFVVMFIGQMAAISWTSQETADSLMWPCFFLGLAVTVRSVQKHRRRRRAMREDQLRAWDQAGRP